MFVLTENQDGTKDLFLTKGDSASIQISIENLDGTIYTILPTDEIIFDVKTHPQSKISLMPKTASASGLITIIPSDTDILTPGLAYVYDVKITHVNGDINTIIPWSKFTVDWTITGEGVST